MEFVKLPMSLDLNLLAFFFNYHPGFKNLGSLNRLMTTLVHASPIMWAEHWLELEEKVNPFMFSVHKH
jgi:hypothetical protein